MNIIFRNSYPPLLREISQVPEKLFCRGDVSVLDKICISVVGTRFSSDYGREMTEKIVKELAVLDVTIVSGLARGIDTIAHESALKNGLKTVAVLGSGLDNVYPRENFALSKKIEKNGLVISEYSKDTAPLQMNFPQRNRLISGLSVATVVTEAPAKSGALITADFALDQGRDIFVVPGDVDRPSGLGTLKLLQNGAAYPVSSGFEIIEMIKKQPMLIKEESHSSKKPSFVFEHFNLNPEETLLVKSFDKRKGSTPEKLAEKSGLPIQEVLTNLSFLEIKKLIYSTQGKYKLKKLAKN
jgi:DNA processing protein